MPAWTGSRCCSSPGLVRLRRPEDSSRCCSVGLDGPQARGADRDAYAPSRAGGAAEPGGIRAAWRADPAVVLQLEAHLVFAGWLEQSTCGAVVTRLDRLRLPRRRPPPVGRSWVLAAQRAIAGAGGDEVIALAERASPPRRPSSEVTPHASNHVGLVLMWAERAAERVELLTAHQESCDRRPPSSGGGVGSRRGHAQRASVRRRKTVMTW